MTYVFIPLGLIVVFIFYILYLAFVKKNLRANIKTVLLPGLFFIAMWSIIYYLLLK